MTTPEGLSPAELEAESASALPDKEVVSILDLNADLDLGLEAAAPIDLAVAANANVAAPIDAAASANVLSTGSEAQALADQGVMINQGIEADATANAVQDSDIGSGSEPAGQPAAEMPAAGSAESADAGGAVSASGLPAAGDLPTDQVGNLPTDQVGTALGGDLLDVDVNLDADLGLNAPINGAVAANANVAAPIDAAVAANIGSVDSQAAAVAQQDAIINQGIEGEAAANAEQSSDIQQ